jgi:phenylalanyl-tRNA synthetase beta chain
MYGATVDEIVPVGEGLREVVIARVVSAQRHPNADRLSLCQVDAGTGTILSVVCGAPNVRADRFYPFAPVGSTLPGGVTIKKAKIRGEESQGMLCSARELGLGRDHEGILELSGEFTPGEPFLDAVGLDDHRIVVDVTANRPDLLSHIGVARELSPNGWHGIQLPAFPGGAAEVKLHFEQVAKQGKAGGIDIAVEDTGSCPRYTAP